jgi:hypothetical protein
LKSAAAEKMPWPGNFHSGLGNIAMVFEVLASYWPQKRDKRIETGIKKNAITKQPYPQFICGFYLPCEVDGFVLFLGKSCLC